MAFGKEEEPLFDQYSAAYNQALSLRTPEEEVAMKRAIEVSLRASLPGVEK